MGMENKINIAELLKNCPMGMELDCTVFGTKVIYQKIYKTAPYPIVVQTEHGFEFRLTQYGQIHNIIGAKCVIFPKGKTTWEGFHRPFRDGDIVAFDNPHRDNLQVFIFKNKEENSTLSSCYLMLDGDVLDLEEGMYYVTRLATDEEKQKLFDAIKATGYKWNEETKTLEKLPKFKIGDGIKNKNSGICDKVIMIFEDCYLVESCLGEQSTIGFDIQDHWELVPNKFDINTLKAFESKVLVRDKNAEKWKSNFWGFYNDTAINYPYECCGSSFAQCIPYEGNEHLLGKTDDCNEYYKTWKE